jgi:hypothetical protein
MRTIKMTKSATKQWERYSGRGAYWVAMCFGIIPAIILFLKEYFQTEMVWVTTKNGRKTEYSLVTLKEFEENQRIINKKVQEEKALDSFVEFTKTEPVEKKTKIVYKYTKV